MKVSVLVPCYQSASFLGDCLESICRQRDDGVELELIVMDGGSTDRTREVVEARGDQVNVFVSELDQGPADAINQGMNRATGDAVAWLNADDRYAPGALRRALEILEARPDASFVFGRCPILDPEGHEIRVPITRFKEMFFPVSCRFTFQCINYISQPATLFRTDAVRKAGPLRLDLKAAWDYEFLLRLWRQGPGLRVKGEPLATFCWHPESISGRHFRLQFEEEFQAAKADAGAYRLQTLIHWGVKWGIIGSYTMMQRRSQA